MTIFTLLGFEPCSDGEFEPGSEKIAVFVDSQQMFTHVAIQLPEVRVWASKMGVLWEDISHATVEGIEGRMCGTVNQFMSRPLPQ